MAKLSRFRLPRLSRTLPSGGDSKAASSAATRIAAFWKWFQRAPGKWHTPGEDFDEQRLTPLHDALAEHFPELNSTVTWEPKKKFGIEFSAPLKPEAAPLIRQIVRAAPKFPGWRFVAFQQPIGFYNLYVAHLGLPYMNLPVDEVRAEAERGGPPWKLNTYLPKYNAKKVESFDRAVRLALIAGLGERFVSEQLGTLAPAPLNKAPSGAVPLSQIAEQLNAKRSSGPTRPARRAPRRGRAQR